MSAPHIPDLSSVVRSAETPKDLSRWHGKREILYDLYICQRKTLKEVKSIMEIDHGFPKTLKRSDYEHVLREEFKFRKNLSADEWRVSVGPRIAARKAEGKRSVVLFNGSKVQNVDRRIQKSFQSKSSRRRTNALPHGVIIRTPSPQLSTLVAPPTLGRNRTANEIESHQRYQSTMDYPADNPLAAASELFSLLTGVLRTSDAGSGATVLSAQLLREGCPINKLLTILDEYQRGFNPTSLRLFGPNATIGILGKMCFDFSNGLHGNTISYSEMTSILDWIGHEADVASFKAFFAQKALTILAVWKTLNSTVRERQHSAAFGVLLTVHLAIKDHAPWTKTTGGRAYDFSFCVALAPTRAATLMNAYPCDQYELDKALKDAVTKLYPTELVKQLISAGASLKDEHCRTSVDYLVRCIEGDELQDFEDGVVRLEFLLEAGAVVDEELLHGDRIGWISLGEPSLATDCLLLSRQHSKNHHRLWSLVSSYSDRQQTDVTVPGIFEAAQGGKEQLRSYLNSRLEPFGEEDRQKVLEIALSEASGRGYVNVVQNLVQFGVDPNARRLTSPLWLNAWHDSWHPVIRALNTGELETVRILLAVSNIDMASLDQQIGAYLDLRALRNMADSQCDQILRVLSTLDLSTSSRSKILLYAVKHACGLHDGPDFKFVNQLLELGVACLDTPEHQDGDTEHILIRAMRMGCGINTLSYLIEQDAEFLSALSATALGALSSVALDARFGHRCHKIIELLTQNIKGFESYIREHSSSLLSSFLENSSCHLTSHNMQHWQEDCEAMVTVRWFLDLGATLENTALANLVLHADDSFMLEMIRNLAEADAVNSGDVLRCSICLGRLNLAVALIERCDALVNGRRIRSGEPLATTLRQASWRGCMVSPETRISKPAATTLQQACGSGAPLGFIRFLVHKGADVNAPPASNGGLTALQAACAEGAELSCIRFLIEKGADVNAPASPNGGFTALQYAAKWGLMNVAGLLLDHGADVNALSGPPPMRYSWPGFKSVRAVDIAAFDSRLDMVHFLIIAGARSCQPGRTGFDGTIKIATQQRDFAIARLLQEHAESRSRDPLEAERRWPRA